MPEATENQQTANQQTGAAPRVMVPTPGRQVWFFGYPWDTNNLHAGARTPYKMDEQPLPATVVHVWNERMVDVDVIDHKGVHWFMTSIHLQQPDDAPYPGAHVEWMPYQAGQAAKG